MSVRVRNFLSLANFIVAMKLLLYLNIIIILKLKKLWYWMFLGEMIKIINPFYITYNTHHQ